MCAYRTLSDCSHRNYIFFCRMRTLIQDFLLTYYSWSQIKPELPEIRGSEDTCCITKKSFINVYYPTTTKNLDNQPLYRETQKSGQKRLPLD